MELIMDDGDDNKKFNKSWKTITMMLSGSAMSPVSMTITA